MIAPFGPLDADAWNETVSPRAGLGLLTSNRAVGQPTCWEAPVLVPLAAYTVNETVWVPFVGYVWSTVGRVVSVSENPCAVSSNCS